MSKIRILLADDHAVLRAGLKTLLNSQPDMEVVAEAGDGEEAVRQGSQTSPDIVLMDITMPGLSGLEATRKIKEQNPVIKVLVLTMHEGEGYLHQTLRSGANGYVPKKAAATELLDAIRTTYRGEYFIHSSMMKWLVAELRNENKVTTVVGQKGSPLSKRETEVLKLFAMGHTSQQIADMLFLSVKTVETHKLRLKRKLGFQGRAKLIRYAIQAGLIDTDA